jgi:hypothetical protein
MERPFTRLLSKRKLLSRVRLQHADFEKLANEMKDAIDSIMSCSLSAENFDVYGLLIEGKSIGFLNFTLEFSLI